jgi:hypothetical protein
MLPEHGMQRTRVTEEAQEFHTYAVAGVTVDCQKWDKKQQKARKNSELSQYNG